MYLQLLMFSDKQYTFNTSVNWLFQTVVNFLSFLIYHYHLFLNILTTHTNECFSFTTHDLFFCFSNMLAFHLIVTQTVGFSRSLSNGFHMSVSIYSFSTWLDMSVVTTAITCTATLSSLVCQCTTSNYLA